MFPWKPFSATQRRLSPLHRTNGRALLARSIERGAPIPAISQRSRYAGAVRYLDSGNRLFEVAAPAYVAAVGVSVPAQIAEAVAVSPYAWSPRRVRGNESIAHEEPLLRPLWVLRDGKVLGVVTFRRQGEHEGLEVIAALKARNKRARFVYLSGRAQAAAEAIAGTIGISTVFGGLDLRGKVRALRKLGSSIMWIGDGASPDAIPCIEASTVSISVAGVSTAASDAADIVLMQPSLQNLVPLRSIGRSRRAPGRCADGCCSGRLWLFRLREFDIAWRGGEGPLANDSAIGHPERRCFGLVFIFMAYVVILGFQGSSASLGKTEAPLNFLAHEMGLVGLPGSTLFPPPVYPNNLFV